jgi:hypothetical protein
MTDLRQVTYDITRSKIRLQIPFVNASRELRILPCLQFYIPLCSFTYSLMTIHQDCNMHIFHTVVMFNGDSPINQSVHQKNEMSSSNIISNPNFHSISAESLYSSTVLHLYLITVLRYVFFVLFYVLFVCTCVLNNCHRVATQLQLNISYHMSFISKYYPDYV